MNALKMAIFALPAAGYHVVQLVRAKAYEWGLLTSRAAPVPVISVGNLLMGGSGKTPFVIALAETLQQNGMKPAVVSRGYRGSNQENYLVVGEGKGRGPTVSPLVCGDEPYLIAKRLPKIPVVIGRKRIHPANAAHKLFGCDVIVLDDGFQHLPLKREVDIVLLNATEDRMFPLGRLREPLSAIERANVVVLVEIDEIPAAVSGYVQCENVFRCRVVPAEFLGRNGAKHDLRSCAGRCVALVSAIANPHRFRKTVESLGCSVVDHFVFPDHYVFTDEDLRRILDRAGDNPVVVTEKDWVKLPEWFKNLEGIMALRITMVIDDQERFLRRLNLLMSARGAQGAS
jgi:tetraacyldisaccharide 4'-kinase